MIKNYLTIRYDPFEKISFNKALNSDFYSKFSDSDGKKTEKLLIKSLQKHAIQKNEPISLSLSSGIDSTLTLGLLRKVFPENDIFGICVVFEGGFDESIVAKSIAKKFDTKFKVIKVNSIFTNISELITIAKKPRWNTYQHFVANEAKKNSSILINGDGADEIFAGYTFRYNKFLNNLNQRDTWLKKTKNYLNCHNRDWVPDQKDLFHKSMKFNWNHIFNYFKSYFSNSLNPLDQVMLADFNGKLMYDFIPTSSKISEYYGLKSFSIFLDPNLIKFGLHIPSSQKYDPETQTGKLILRQITKRLGIEHINEKRGFSPDLLIDWQRYGKKICDSKLLNLDSRIYTHEIINNDWLQTAINKINDDGDIRYLNRVVSILALEYYLEIFSQ